MHNLSNSNSISSSHLRLRQLAAGKALLDQVWICLISPISKTSGSTQLAVAVGGVITVAVTTVVIAIVVEREIESERERERERARENELERARERERERAREQ